MMKSSSAGGLLFLAAAVFIAFMFFSSTYIVSAAGNFSCSITASGSCSYTKVLYLKNDTGGYYNAHAENVSDATYPYVICCDSNSTLSYNCGEATVVKLNATTNTHVQRGDYSGAIVYGISACLSGAPGYVSCTYVDDSCPTDRECFASMASAFAAENNDTNAHLGPCAEYMRKICCRVIPGLIVTYVSPTPGDNTRRTSNSETINVTVTSDSGVSVDTCTLEWNGANESMTMRGTGSNVTCDATKATMDGTDYTFKVYANDSVGNIASESLRTFRENDEPAKVILTSPANYSHTTDRTPTFTWEIAGDADGDDVNYTINITCFLISGGGCAAGEDIYESDIDATSYTPSRELNYFGDDNYYYNWSVHANDGYENGTWSDTWELIIDTNVSLVMLNATVDFGENRILGYTDNTSDNNPYPLSVRSASNCMIDVNISASNLLWETAPEPSSYFQYKVDWLSGEAGAFNWSGSQTDWESVPQTNTTFVDYLNYSAGNSSLEIDIAIQVPGEESPGPKSSTLIFAGEYHR